MKTALTFDIGGTKIASALVRESGEVLKSSVTSTNTQNGSEQFIKDIVAAGSELSNEINFDCVGISSAGPLDPIKGTLINPTNLKTKDSSWGEIQLTAPLQKSFQVPTVLENDAAAAVVGELWKGEHKGSQSILTITLGTGVGVGAIIEGQLQRNRNGFHPEVSHMSINHTDTKATCGCGNLGCIEAYLSGRNFPSYYSKVTGGPDFSGKEFVEHAANKEPYALKGFQLYSELMANALHSLILTYSPEVIVFAGSFSKAFEFFHENVEDRLKHMLKDRREGMDYLPELKLSKIADRAGLLGAAKMAFYAPQRL